MIYKHRDQVVICYNACVNHSKVDDTYTIPEQVLTAAVDEGFPRTVPT
jgi:hypothetical protein